MNPTLGGDLRLIDSETGDVRDLTADAEALRGYRDRLRAFLERVEGFCRAQEIGYHRVTTDTPVEAFVRRPAGGAACSDELSFRRWPWPPLRSRSRWCCSTSSRCGGASGACRACMFWEAVQRDREASTFFQRLQRDPLLILQILALLALSLALAQAGGHRDGRGLAQGRGRAGHLRVHEGARRVAHALRRRPAARRCSSCAGCARAPRSWCWRPACSRRSPRDVGRDRDRARGGHRRSAKPTTCPTVSSRRCAPRGRWSASIRRRGRAFTDGAYRARPHPETDNPRCSGRGSGGAARTSPSPACRTKGYAARSTTRRSPRWWTTPPEEPDVRLLCWSVEGQTLAEKSRDPGAERAALGRAAVQSHRRWRGGARCR